MSLQYRERWQQQSMACLIYKNHRYVVVVFLNTLTTNWNRLAKALTGRYSFFIIFKLYNLLVSDFHYCVCMYILEFFASCICINVLIDQTNGSRELTQIRTKTTKAYLVSILETRAAPTLNTDSDYLHNL